MVSSLEVLRTSSKDVPEAAEGPKVDEVVGL